MKKGFTLIELLIVVAIIGILSVALVPTGLNALKKSRDGTRIAHLDAIVSVLSEYNLDTSSKWFATGTVAAFKNITCIQLPAAYANADLKSAIKAYFQGSQPPSDPTGNNKDFNGSITDVYSEGCSYYIRIGTDYFVVWAQMELAESGNYDPTKHNNLYPQSTSADTENLYVGDSSGPFYFKRVKFVN